VPPALENKANGWKVINLRGQNR